MSSRETPSSPVAGYLCRRRKWARRQAGVMGGKASGGGLGRSGRHWRSRCIPPWFIKLGCSTPVRSPSINGSVSMGVWDGLSDGQPSEVMSEMGKPSLVVRHRNDREDDGSRGSSPWVVMRPVWRSH